MAEMGQQETPALQQKQRHLFDDIICDGEYIVGGTEIPSALAVRRLITNSNPGEKKSLGEPHVVAAPWCARDSRPQAGWFSLRLWP
jgi:hypothetical protein